MRAEAERSRLLAAGNPLCHCSNPAGRDALRARENEQSRVSTGILPLLKQLALHAAWNAVNSRLFPWQTSRPQLVAESLVNLEYLALEHEDVASRTCCFLLSCSLGRHGSLCQAMAGPRGWHKKGQDSANRTQLQKRERVLGERSSKAPEGGISLDKEFRSVRAVAVHQHQFWGSVPSSAQSLLQTQVSQPGSGASPPQALIMPALLGGIWFHPFPQGPCWDMGIAVGNTVCWHQNLVCCSMVPEAQLLILGEVIPQCPVLHILRAAQHNMQFTGTLCTVCGGGEGVLIQHNVL